LLQPALSKGCSAIPRKSKFDEDITIILQKINSGVGSLRIPNWLKSKRFPADCLKGSATNKLSKKNEGSQHTARFRAGRKLPANTGSVISSRIAVTKMAQQNNGILWSNIPSVLILSAVLMKLIAFWQKKPAAMLRKILNPIFI